MNRTMTGIITVLSMLLCMAAECGGGDEPQPVSLEVPSGVTVHAVTQTSLTFQWSPVTGAESYDWKLSQSGSEVQSGSVRNRNVMVTGLTAGTKYQFVVRAVSQTASSDFSSPLTASTEVEPTPPGPGLGRGWCRPRFPRCRRRRHVYDRRPRWPGDPCHESQ